MEIQGPGNINKAHKIEQTRQPSHTERLKSDYATRGEDSAEFSEISQLLSKLSSTPEIRGEKVEAIRQEIERGEYLTEDKLNAAADKLFELLE